MFFANNLVEKYSVCFVSDLQLWIKGYARNLKLFTIEPIKSLKIIAGLGYFNIN